MTKPRRGLLPDGIERPWSATRSHRSVDSSLFWQRIERLTSWLDKLTARLSKKIDNKRYRFADFLANKIRRINRRASRLDFGTKRIFFVVHNTNHLSIFRDVVRELASRKVMSMFVTIGGHTPERTVAALKAEGLSRVDLSEVLRSATEGDLVCVGNDWSPTRLRKALARLRDNGVKIVGVVEGARFLLRHQWRQVDELLCWGPSGLDVSARCVQIVGSPIIERASRAARREKKSARVLINYKFSGKVTDVGFAWGYAAVEAAREIDPHFMFSTHPFNIADVPPDVEVSDQPFSKLLTESTVIITRSSTVIYEALVSGVAVIYVPLADEPRAEFGDSADAFDIAESYTELLDKIKLHASPRHSNKDVVRVFLDRHVSIDPQRSAIQRIADALTNSISDNQG